MRLVGPCLVRSGQTARHTAQIPRPSSDPNGSFAVTVLSLPDTLQTAASGCEEPANPAVILAAWPALFHILLLLPQIKAEPPRKSWEADGSQWHMEHTAVPRFCALLRSEVPSGRIVRRSPGACKALIEHLADHSVPSEVQSPGLYRGKSPGKSPRPLCRHQASYWRAA
jgi:hypothetical protein